MSKSAKPLPKTPVELPGGVIAERKRCGKPTCRCASGKPSDRHGPYFYRYWRAGGRLYKTYVPRDQVRHVRAACARRQEREREERHIHPYELEMIREVEEQERVTLETYIEKLFA